MTRDEQIVAAYQAGESQQKIAPRFGLSQTRVSGILIKAGVARGRHHRIVPTDPTLRTQYEKLRRCLGIEVARREMGL